MRLQSRVALITGAGQGIGAACARRFAQGGEARRKIPSRSPLGRCGEPEELAAVGAFLASDDASYLTGQTIYPDGGRRALNCTVPVADRR